MARSRTGSAGTKYWLMKSEPDVYGIDDLERDGSTMWDGVRNYQARNFMRDEMQVGDGVLFYHSNAKPMAIVGLARVSRSAYADPTQFGKGRYHDPKATKDEPRWFLVDIEFVCKFEEPLPLDFLKGRPELAGMPLLQKGQRLSVQPVSAGHWKAITKMAGVSPLR
jgi:predicted RNA-binding protein with PUA-like domain